MSETFVSKYVQFSTPICQSAFHLHNLREGLKVLHLFPEDVSGAFQSIVVQHKPAQTHPMVSPSDTMSAAGMPLAWGSPWNSNHQWIGSQTSNMQAWCSSGCAKIFCCCMAIGTGVPIIIHKHSQIHSAVVCFCTYCRLGRLGEKDCRSAVRWITGFCWLDTTCCFVKTVSLMCVVVVPFQDVQGNMIVKHMMIGC